jgi:uncharacterized protein YcaQ
LAGPQPTADIEGIKNILEDIRCLQIDPIRAVERTQYLVLWSRLGNYDMEDLHRLIYEEKYLFEYWAHAASLVRTADYPLFRTKMNHYMDQFDGEKAWQIRYRSWMEENSHLEATILDELARKGPMSSDQFEDESVREWTSSGWSNGRTVNRMLDFLWSQGKIMVAHRSGLKRFWDLSQRCLPEWMPKESLDKEQMTYRAAQIALQALGVGRPRHIKDHFTRNEYHDLKEVVKQLVDDGCFVPLLIEPEVVGDEAHWPGQWYVHVNDLPLLDSIEQGDWQPRTTLLSPFDNLICNRDRTEAMWDFYYRIEIYVPKDKRQFGYYVLPILHGERLIGRISPKMDRKKRILNVEAVYAEEAAPMTAEVGRAVQGSIENLAEFLGAKAIDYGEMLPKGWNIR